MLDGIQEVVKKWKRDKEYEGNKETAGRGAYCNEVEVTMSRVGRCMVLGRLSGRDNETRSKRR